MLRVISLIIAVTVSFAGEDKFSDKQTCELAQKYLTDLTITCDDKYHHYLSNQITPSKNTSRLQIASWNVFNLGFYKQRFKNIALLAELADRQGWDIIAATEIFPLDAKLVSSSSWPGAIQLLQELRKLDPSWSLIIAPYGLGSEGSSTVELGGVYYKASRLQAITTESCEALACIIKLPAQLYPGLSEEMLGELVSREPFIASFQALNGNFDFSLMPFHARFRQTKAPEVMDAIVGAKRTSDGNITFEKGIFFNIEDILGKERAENFRKKLAQETKAPVSQTGARDSIKELLSRYAELSAIGRFIQNIKSNQKEQDIIWAGDFNLEYDLRRFSDWDVVLLKNELKGAKVLVSELTSLSDKERLASNYDHFILNPKDTAECKESSAGVVDFMQPGVLPSLKKYLVFLNDPTGFFEKKFFKQNEKLYSPSDLLKLAQNSPETFEKLSAEQRLGLTLHKAKEIIESQPNEQKSQKLRLEKVLLETLQNRFDLLEKKYKSIRNQNQRAEEFVSQYAQTLDPQAEDYAKSLLDFRRRLFDSQWQVDPTTAKDIRYQVYRELVSDHLPISISCGVSSQDDD